MIVHITAGALVMMTLGGLLTVLASLHRWRAERRLVRQEERLRRIRPFLLAIATSDDIQPGVDELRGIDGDLLERAAVDMLPKLRGEAHVELVALLTRRGVLDTARRRLSARRAHTRARAALLIGAVGDRDSVDDVIALLDDPVPEVARVAARTLGKQGDPRAVPRLLAALDGPHALPVGIVSTALLRIGRAATEPLVAALATAAPLGRAAAAEVLGRLDAVEATAPLLDALRHDPDREVRLRSAHALGRIGAPKAAPTLTELMTSTDDSTMQAICARSLGEVGNPATAPLLVTLLGDPQHTVASSAATALVALGDAGIAALQALVDEHGPGAAYARQALAVTWLRSGIAQDVLRA